MSRARWAGAMWVVAAALGGCGNDSTAPGAAIFHGGTGGSANGGSGGGGGGTTSPNTGGAGGSVGGNSGGAVGADASGTGGGGGSSDEDAGAAEDASAGSGGAGGGAGNCKPAVGTSPKKAIRPNPTQLHEAVAKFFGSSDPFIKNTILPNVEKYRKSDATVKILTADDKPAAGYNVTAILAHPDFKWGSCPPKATVGPEKATPPAEEKLWGEMFNYGIPQSTAKWASIEGVRGTYDYSGMDTLLATMKRNGVQMEQHFMVGYHPDWLASLASDADRAKAQEAFALNIVERYKDQIEYWQVYNEDYKTHIDRANIYVDETGFFKKVASTYPNLKFGVNDCWQFIEEGGLPAPATVKTRFPGIHFLGVHVHNPRRLWASPQQIYQTFDPYTNSGVFLHMTEFGIIKDENGDASIVGTARSGTWTDDLLAEYFVQTFVTTFSHPAVEAFNHFGVGPEINRYTGNNLFQEGGILTPAYHALRSLLVDKLRTLAEGVTDAGGQLKYRGFQGEYEVTVTSPTGATTVGRFYLKPGGPQEFTFKVTGGSEPLCLAQ